MNEVVKGRVINPPLKSLFFVLVLAIFQFSGFPYEILRKGMTYGGGDWSPPPLSMPLIRAAVEITGKVADLLLASYKLWRICHLSRIRAYPYEEILYAKVVCILIEHTFNLFSMIIPKTCTSWF